MLGSIRYELKQKYRKFLQSHTSQKPDPHTPQHLVLSGQNYLECLATAFTPLDSARRDVDWPTRFVDYVI